jgi:hypothetical protein
MVKKPFLIACVGVGFAVIATMSILSQPSTDGENPFSSQLDVIDLTLNAPNLPIHVTDGAI